LVEDKFTINPTQSEIPEGPTPSKSEKPKKPFKVREKCVHPPTK